MGDPVFSVIAPAIRPEYYKKCYDLFCQGSSVAFEMIFIGNKPPMEFVGDHFRYIYSPVKPAQCIEIGARESNGKYIIPVTDDMTYSDKFLDNLYIEISNTDLNKYFLSFKGGHAGSLVFDKNIKKSPVIGWCGCYPSVLWKKIGGVDRRFVHTFFDIDLQMRCYEIGMDIKLTECNCVGEFFPDFGPKATKEKTTKKFMSSRMINRYGKYSRRLLNSFWVNPDGTMSKKRLSPVEPFDDKDIKEITQGEKGEW